MKSKLFIVLFMFMVSCKSKTPKYKFDYEYEYHSLINKIINELEGDTWIEEGSPSMNYILDIGFPKILDYKEINDLYPYGIIKNTKFTNINTQISHFKNYKLKQNLLNSKLIISNDTIQKLIYQDRKRFWKLYESHYGKSGFYGFSYPIFSVDKKSVIIKVSTALFRLKGTSFAWYLCKKKNQRWIVEDILLEGF